MHYAGGNRGPVRIGAKNHLEKHLPEDGVLGGNAKDALGGNVL